MSLGDKNFVNSCIVFKIIVVLRGCNQRGVNVTSYIQLVLRLRMSGAVIHSSIRLYDLYRGDSTSNENLEPGTQIRKVFAGSLQKFQDKCDFRNVLVTLFHELHTSFLENTFYLQFVCRLSTIL
jgi:hypothetical protein